MFPNLSTLLIQIREIMKVRGNIIDTIENKNLSWYTVVLGGLTVIDETEDLGEKREDGRTNVEPRCQ